MNATPWRATGATSIGRPSAAPVLRLLPGSSSQPRSFVDAHAPHGRASHPCSHASTSTRVNAAGVVGPRPSTSLDDAYVQAHRPTRVREDHPERQGQPPGKLADAEVIFEADAGPLSGMKLIGFAVWERRDGGKNVTFPARQYSVNGERRSFALLRPSTEDRTSQEAIRDCILDAYDRLEAAS